MGHAWCHQQGFVCRLDEADLVKRQSRWKVKFDAERPRGRHGRGKAARGKVKLEFDAWNGALLKADTSGKLRRG